MAAICGNVASNQQLIGTLMGSLLPGPSPGDTKPNSVVAKGPHSVARDSMLEPCSTTTY